MITASVIILSLLVFLMLLWMYSLATHITRLENRIEEEEEESRKYTKEHVESYVKTWWEGGFFDWGGHCEGKKSYVDSRTRDVQSVALIRIDRLAEALGYEYKDAFMKSSYVKIDKALKNKRK